MRHAPLAPKRSILNRLVVLTPLVLGPILLVSGCDRSSNSPASPRTSEIVRLSQAPVDAVPLSETSRAARNTAPKPEDKPLEEVAASEDSQTVPAEAATATSPAASTPPPASPPAATTSPTPPAKAATVPVSPPASPPAQDR